MKQKTMLLDAYNACEGNPLRLLASIETIQRSMGAELNQLINSYHISDWPHLMAVMRATVDATLPHLGPEGRQVYEDALHDLQVISFQRTVQDDE